MPDRYRVMNQTKTDTPCLPGWGLGVELTTLAPKKTNCSRTASDGCRLEESCK